MTPNKETVSRAVADQQAFPQMWKRLLRIGLSLMLDRRNAGGKYHSPLAVANSGPETEGYPKQRFQGSVKGGSGVRQRTFRVVPMTCINGTWIYCPGTREAAVYFATKLERRSAARLNGSIQ